MGKVIFNMTASLDGYVAGPNDGPNNPLGDGGEALFTWYKSGDIEYKMPGGDWKFKISAASAARARAHIRSGHPRAASAQFCFQILPSLPIPTKHPSSGCHLR